MFIGVVILLVPEILVAFVASVFLLGGSALLFLGWKMRKFFNRAQRIKIRIDD
ncbi:MAG: hypothetical protein WAN36_10295 [Calditrichia bacterium]